MMFHIMWIHAHINTDTCAHTQSPQAPPSSHLGPPTQQAAVGPRPTFPAYQDSPFTSAAAGGAPPPLPTLPDVPLRPVAKVPPVGDSSKLIHPEDDISMVGIYIIC